MSGEKKTFAENYLTFIRTTEIPLSLPDDTELLYPFDDTEVRAAMDSFYSKYYADGRKRIFLIGINPGRFGGGVTGIPFTDPEALETCCSIPHAFTGGRELSSRFIYEMIDHCGGPDLFFSRYFLTSLSPLGFTWKGKNRNYYDTPALYAALKPWLISSFKRQLDAGADRETAFSLGQGKNFTILRDLNREHGFFNEIRPLPHPRWVMQYRLKDKDDFLDMYKSKLTTAYEESN